MTISQRNVFWHSMAPDRREQCLREVLKTKFNLDDEEFYGQAEHMSSLVGTDDTGALPADFAQGIESWLKNNLPDEVIVRVTQTQDELVTGWWQDDDKVRCDGTCHASGQDVAILPCCDECGATTVDGACP